MSTGLRDAMYHLGNALREAEGVALAAAGWTWGVWFVPTEKSLAAWPHETERMVGGGKPFLHREDAEEYAWMVTSEDRAPDRHEYFRYDVRPIPPPHRQ